MQLIKYDAARKALQEASSIDEVKDTKDKVEALQAYARQQKNTEMEAWLADLKLRAIRRIGEISKGLETAERQRTDLRPTGGQQTKTQTLKEAGLSTSAANRAEQISEIPLAEFEAYINKKKSENKPVKINEVISKITADNREKRQRKDLQKKPPILPSGLHHGDFRELSKLIPDESVELVFTDPPYDRKSIPMFGEAAEIASRILRPGGSMISYCGQIQLPEVLTLMSNHLRYWWVNACIHSGGSHQMNKYGIKVDWKPMVWFVKGTRGDVQTFVHDSVTGDKEKLHHEWQQAQSEAEYYIDKLCSPDGVVVDFFAGGGTTLSAANKLKRKWIAYEIDAIHISKAAERLSV